MQEEEEKVPIHAVPPPGLDDQMDDWHQDIATGTAEQNRRFTSAEEYKGGLILLTLHTFQFHIRRRWKCCGLTAKPNHFGSSAEQLGRLKSCLVFFCFYSNGLLTSLQLINLFIFDY